VQDTTQPREFTLLYDFNNQGWNTRTVPPVRQAFEYLKVTDAREVEVVGYRGGALLSDGTSFIENEGVGEMRAKQVELILKQIGVPAGKLKVRWETRPTQPTGIDDWNTRRAVITVRP
jgi:outer membrane protein OmpA-like peptidoglycan-associated protein